MQKQNIQQIISELFRENLNMYPESYPLNEDGTATNEASETVADVAKGYWENRNEEETERDENAGVTLIDYVECCMSEFSSNIEIPE